MQDFDLIWNKSFIKKGLQEDQILASQFLKQI